MIARRGGGDARAAGTYGRRCPVCGAPSDPAARPFCSPRCAKVDLNRWLSGGYAIPVAEEDIAPDPDAED